MVLAFVRRYVMPFWPKYLLGLLFLFATVQLTVGIPGLIKQVIDELSGQRRIATIDQYALTIAGFAVLVIFVRTFSRVLFFNPGREIEFAVRNELLARLLRMSPAYFRRQTLGDLLSRTNDDATFVRALVGFTPVMALNIIVSAALSSYRMLRTDLWLTLTCVVPMIAASFILRVAVRRSFTMMRVTQEALGKVSDTVLETYKGVAVVQGAAAEQAYLARFDQDNQRFTSLSLQVIGVRTFVFPIVAVVGNLCILLLLFMGGDHVVHGLMTLGDLAAYSSYVGVLVSALASAGWVIGSIQRGIVSLRRVWDILQLQADTPEGSLPLVDDGRGLHLQLRDLTYRHPDAAPDAQPVISHLSFNLESGKVLGIYGAVASGKSTLVSLLSRLQPPPPGTVFINGIDILEIREADLRAAVAVVPQEAFLFSRSVRDNVAFADGQGAADPARVQSALEKAQVIDEIDRFESGLDTVIGERGLSVSGGQRQRLQIARAFYRGFRLLLLDDVLSAVDHDTEARLLHVLQTEIAERGTSAVIISHRLSALRQAQEIVVLGEHGVAERGSHAELLALNGIYARVWQTQQQSQPELAGDAAVPQAQALVA